MQDLRFRLRESQEEEWSKNPPDVRSELERVEFPPEPGRASRWQGPVAERLREARGCKEESPASGANFAWPG